MKRNTILASIHFSLLLAVPFIIALFIIALSFGCQQNKPEEKIVKPTITQENLQTAYKKAFRYAQMYELFTKEAEKERLTSIANLFRAVARSEEIHAANHAALLRHQNVEPEAVTPEQVVVGTTMQTLKMALNSEELEGESMYPNLVRTAQAENLPDAVTQLQQSQDADLRHKELIQEALNKSGKIVKVSYWICPQCGYIFTSNKTDECPVCKSQSVKFEKI